jgi:hypothetical protein
MERKNKGGQLTIEQTNKIDNVEHSEGNRDMKDMKKLFNKTVTVHCLTMVNYIPRFPRLH